MSSSLFVGSSISAKNSEDISAKNSEDISAKMVKINVKSFSEEDLRKRFNDLSRKEDWDKECEQCKNPVLLHKTNCTRKVEVEEAEFSELWKIWGAFRAKLEPIRR